MPRAALVVGASVRVAGRGAATICEVDGPLVFYEYGGGEGSEGSSHPKRRYHRNVLARSTGAACFLKPEAVAAAAAGDGGAAAAREKAAHQQLLDSYRHPIHVDPLVKFLQGSLSNTYTCEARHKTQQ